MTWLHVVVIAMALLAVTFCASSPACAPHLSGVIQLATAVVGIAGGNALGARKRARLTPRPAPVNRTVNDPDYLP